MHNLGCPLRLNILFCLIKKCAFVQTFRQSQGKIPASWAISITTELILIEYLDWVLPRGQLKSQLISILLPFLCSFAPFSITILLASILNLQAQFRISNTIGKGFGNFIVGKRAT